MTSGRNELPNGYSYHYMIYILCEGKVADRERVEAMTIEEAEEWLCFRSYENYIGEKHIEDMKRKNR